MINPHSSVYKIDDKLCFFGIKPNKQDLDLLKEFMETISKNSQGPSNIKVNYFKDGDNILGEALIRSKDNIRVARSLKTTIPDVIRDLDKQLAKKLLDLKHL